VSPRKAAVLRLAVAAPLWASGFNLAHGIYRQEWGWIVFSVFMLGVGVAATISKTYFDQVAADRRVSELLQVAVLDAAKEGVIAGVEVVVDAEQLHDFEVSHERLDKAVASAVHHAVCQDPECPIIRKPPASS
jgi:hypothetical protein